MKTLILLSSLTLTACIPTGGYTQGISQYNWNKQGVTEEAFQRDYIQCRQYANSYLNDSFYQCYPMAVDIQVESGTTECLERLGYSFFILSAAHNKQKHVYNPGLRE